MKVRIEIDTKTFVRFWLVVMGFGLAGLAIYSAKDALILLGISAFGLRDLVCDSANCPAICQIRREHSEHN